MSWNIVKLLNPTPCIFKEYDISYKKKMCSGVYGVVKKASVFSLNMNVAVNTTSLVSWMIGG